MNGKNNLRLSMIAVVAGYMLYTAYQLFDNRNDPDSGMSMGVLILFVAFFSLAGIGLFAYAFYLWKKGKQEEKNNDEREGMK